MKKRGFTLAEVLITLVIIGVISALVLPQFISGTHNQSHANKLASITSDYETIFGAMMMKENQENFFNTAFGSAYLSGDTANMQSALAAYTKMSKSGSSTMDLGYLSYNFTSPLMPAAFAAATNSKPCGSASYTGSITNTSECKAHCESAGWVWIDDSQLDFHCVPRLCPANTTQEWYSAPKASWPGSGCSGSLNAINGGIITGWRCCTGSPCPEDKPLTIVSPTKPYPGCTRNNPQINKEFWCCPEKVENPCPDDKPSVVPVGQQYEGCITVPGYKEWWKFGYCCPKPSNVSCDNPEYPIYSKGDGKDCIAATGGVGFCCKEKPTIDPCAADPCSSPSCPGYNSAQCCHRFGGYWYNNQCNQDACPDEYPIKSRTGGNNCIAGLESTDITSAVKYFCCKKTGPGPSPDPCANAENQEQCKCNLEPYNHWVNGECIPCKPPLGHWNESDKKCIICNIGETWDGTKCVGEDPDPENPIGGEPTDTPMHTITNGHVQSDNFEFVFGEGTTGGANVFFDQPIQYHDEGNNIHFAATLYIDVNGSASPNKFGRDVFAFVLTEDGHLYPYGSQKAAESLGLNNPESHTWRGSEERYGCTGNGFNGLGCTGRLVEHNYKVDY